MVGRSQKALKVSMIASIQSLVVHEIISYTNYNDNFKDYQGDNQSTHSKKFMTN
jgi:hypothetical protein